jgi:hypothetical protein
MKTVTQMKSTTIGCSGKSIRAEVLQQNLELQLMEAMNMQINNLQ